MQLIVTMAGASNRFARAGYTEPKWSLDFGGVPVLRAAVESIGGLLKPGDCITAVCLEDHERLARECMAESPVAGDMRWCAIPEVFNGQAQTAAHAVEKFQLMNQQIVIWNVDTVLVDLEEQMFPRDGNWLCVAEMPGDRWSFAKRGAGGLVEATAEKQRISNLASVGLYSFATGKDFLEALSATYEGDAQEQYIAPVYNYLIERGVVVLAPEISSEQVIEVGTPASYESWVGQTRNG